MFPSNFRLKHFLAVVMLVVSILSACQPAPSSSSKVENQNSQALKFVIESKDIPGKWSWASITVNQPSQAEWINHENLSDSAASYLKGDYWVAGKSYYISVFHNVAQYSKPIPDSESPILNSVFDSSKQINPPNFQTFSNKTEKACFDSDVYYDCTVVENYEFIKSYITIIAPKELGMQELESLLNSILKVGSSKFSHVEKN